MKKRKTYEISVIDKTSSKMYSDLTKFYTSDTALELFFYVKEAKYDFDSAEIILLNVDDRSLVTRPVVKSAEGFTYELEDDITAHFGEWRCQLKFTEGGEVYVSSPVSFRIENDLSNDRPPQLTEVNTWKNLRAIADGLIADIRNELESAVEQLSEIESAESERQSAELIRVENENQRKTDHANRSAELDRKADKVVLKNLIKNGDFSDGLTGWIGSGSALTDHDGFIRGTTETASPYPNIQASVKLNSVDVYYFKAKVRVGQPSDRISFRVNSVDTIPFTRVTNPKPNTWYTLSTISKGTADAETLRIYHDYTTKYEPTLGNTIDIDKTVGVIAINLTQTFGTGNEPTKEEMDRLIEITGYIDDEYALNNKELLIWTLSLLRSNRNAIISLGGTI